MAARKPYRASRRLYLSRDKERVVEEGDPEAGFLLASEGAEVPQAEVDRYGLRELPGPEEAETAADAKEEPEGKMVAAPPENKAQAAPAEKAPAPPRGATRKDSA